MNANRARSDCEAPFSICYNDENKENYPKYLELSKIIFIFAPKKTCR